MAANFFLPLIHCVLWTPNSLFLLLRGQAPACNKLVEKHPTTLLLSVRLARAMHRATEKGGKTVDLLGFHEVSAAGLAIA